MLVAQVPTHFAASPLPPAQMHWDPSSLMIMAVEQDRTNFSPPPLITHASDMMLAPSKGLRSAKHALPWDKGKGKERRSAESRPEESTPKGAFTICHQR